MLSKKLILCIGTAFASCSLAFSSYAQPPALVGGDGFGQTIQITTRLHSFVGRPTWSLIIRDLDHNENIPYLFDITRGQDFWVAFTYGRNYVITASTLQIESYRACCNSYDSYRIHDFCHLESRGRIQRAESMFITITGHLSPNRNTYTCNVSKFKDTNFVIVPDP